MFFDLESDVFDQRRHTWRDEDEVFLFGEPEPLSAIDELMGAGRFTEMMARTGPLGKFFMAQDEVVARMWKLLDFSPRKRREALRRPEYRDLAIAESLLVESAKAQPSSIQSSMDMAALAQRLSAEALPDELARASAVRAHAWCLQANARRLLRDWKGAEGRFGAAYAELSAHPDARVTAIFYDLVAALRQDQDRLEEAMALLWQAALLYGREWIEVDTGRCLLRIAWITLTQGDPGSAMAVLTSLRTLAEGSSVLSIRQIDLFRAICFAAAGLAEPARRLIEEARPQRRYTGQLDARVPLEWLECRIYVRLGDLDRAIPRLEALRRWLLRREDLVAVCLCSIDLAHAHAKAGRGVERFPGLLEDIARLPGAAEQVWPLGSLWTLREAIEQEGDLEAALRRATALVLQRTERLNELVQHPVRSGGASKRLR